MFKLNVCLILYYQIIIQQSMNEKQIEILEAAEVLFSTKGFDGTSVRDIAKAANVNVAMISYYFGSKDKLLETLFEDRISGFKMKTDAIYNENISSFERLEILIDTYIKAMNTNAGLYQILAVEGTIKKRLLISPAFTDLKKFNLEVISNVINKGIEEGVFNKNSNPILIHATMMGTFMNFQMNRPFLQEVLDFHSEEAYLSYIENELTDHIHRTIKALLTYEE